MALYDASYIMVFIQKNATTFFFSSEMNQQLDNNKNEIRQLFLSLQTNKQSETKLSLLDCKDGFLFLLFDLIFNETNLEKQVNFNNFSN